MAKRVIINKLVRFCSECPYIDYEHFGIAEPVCRSPNFTKKWLPPVMMMKEIDVMINENCPLEDD